MLAVRRLGIYFTWQPMLGVWKLHAWLYRPNPAGLFEDFNPWVKRCPG